MTDNPHLDHDIKLELAKIKDAHEQYKKTVEHVRTVCPHYNVVKAFATRTSGGWPLEETRTCARCGLTQVGRDPDEPIGQYFKIVTHEELKDYRT